MENIISFHFGTYDFRNFKAEKEDRGFFANHIDRLYSDHGKKLVTAVREFVRDASMNPNINAAFSFTNEPLMGSERRNEAYGLSVGGLTFASATITNLYLENEEFLTGEQAITEFEKLTEPYKGLEYTDDGVTPRLAFVGIAHHVGQLILRKRTECNFLVRANENFIEVIVQEKENPDTNVSVKLVIREDVLIGKLTNAGAAVI